MYDDESRHTAGTRWPQWLRDFELFLVGSGVVDEGQKKAILLYVVGSAAREVYYTLKKDDDDYKAVKKVFGDYFMPLKNLDYEIFSFGQLRQRETESMDDFIVRLRVAAGKCEFANADQEIKKQIIAGCKSVKLKEHILAQQGMALADIQTKARMSEAAWTQAKAIGSAIGGVEVKSEPICAVKAKGKSTKCFACGYVFPHEGECPAKGKKCNVCNEVGHFAVSKYCKKKVNLVSERAESEDRAYLFEIKCSSHDSARPMVKAELCGEGISFLVDTGAMKNILDEKTFLGLSFKPYLEPIESKLYPYGVENELVTNGEFKATVKFKDKFCQASFVVVKGGFGNILGFETARELDVFGCSFFYGEVEI